jgi:hypothetical protein
MVGTENALARARAHLDHRHSRAVLCISRALPPYPPGLDGRDAKQDTRADTDDRTAHTDTNGARLHGSANQNADAEIPRDPVCGTGLPVKDTTAQSNTASSRALAVALTRPRARTPRRGWGSLTMNCVRRRSVRTGLG